MLLVTERLKSVVGRGGLEPYLRGNSPCASYVKRNDESKAGCYVA